MGCVPTHATPTCCAGWGCRSPSNLSAGRKVGRLTILPFLAQGPSMLSVPDPHKHFFKDIGEEMARRRPGLDLLVRFLLLHTPTAVVLDVRRVCGWVFVEKNTATMPDGSGRGQACSEAEHDARREAKIILRDSENMSEQPVSLHSPSHPFDQLVIKPAPDVFGK